MKTTKKIKSTLPKDLQRAIDIFPKVVAQKKARAIARKKFIEKTFGALVRDVERQTRKFNKLK